MPHFYAINPYIKINIINYYNNIYSISLIERIEYLHSKKPKLADIDQLFGSYTAEDQRCDAYRLKNKEIGYKPQYELEESY